MTIALNILLAVIVFIGVVGLLAFNIYAARTPGEPKPSRSRVPSRTRAHGSLRSARVA